MLSEEIKKTRIRDVVDTFLANPDASTFAVSNLCRVSTSTVQRYLRDPLVKEMYSAEICEMIDARLLQNKIDGHGGEVSQQLHGFLKAPQGQFQGCKGLNNHYSEYKQYVELLLELYAGNPNVALENIAERIPNCSTNDLYYLMRHPFVETILGHSMFSKMNKQLLDLSTPVEGPTLVKSR